MLRLLALLLALALAPSASAALITQYASVPRKGGVNDGDTIDAMLGGKRKHIRFIGVQAMELTTYSMTPSKWRGECGAVAAGRYVLKMVQAGGYRVRLQSEAQVTDTTGRLERSVAVKVGGRWLDLGEGLMKRGLTLWLHNTKEPKWNRRYNILGQQAALKGIGLFKPTACGSGPVQSVPFKVWVMSDPVGEDPPRINEEYIRVQNRSPSTTVSLRGWWVSDAGPKQTGRYHFPAATKLGPGQTLTVRTGKGTNSAFEFFRGLNNPQFENTTRSRGGLLDPNAGDGAYLFDPKGDIRAHMIYPCLVSCTDVNQGAVDVTANATRGPEFVLIKNVSGHDVDLFGYELRLPGGYGFGPNSVLHPGETMSVAVEGNPRSDTRLSKHIGYGGAYLPDSGGTAAVTTFDEIVLGCDSWGNGRC